ncbi:unnamed protein product [Pleuronectes platessa]|uniref:Leukocyte cell-derived chemotaxin 1 n=1 Tax=Pleuronectes platessa TaxID=8262 RepID=A0A9N7TP05_PLEPL|nr:unnamed protein product [Pleuronectes platessa]
MAGSSEKVPIASAGPEDLQQFMPPVSVAGIIRAPAPLSGPRHPAGYIYFMTFQKLHKLCRCDFLVTRTPCQAYSAVAVKPAATGRLLKAGIAVLIAGALLLLLGAVGAFYFWNNNEKHEKIDRGEVCEEKSWVYNVHYSMSINGKVEEGSMEIDTANNMERFSTSSGAEEAVEVHDFEIGITGIRFSGGEKCYIKTQVKARLPDVETLNKETMTFNLEDEVMPAKFEDDLIWVAADTPLSDSAFLSNKIKDLCGELPIFWLRPTYSTSGQRKRRAALRQRRQAAGAAAEKEEDVEAELNPENPYQGHLRGPRPGRASHGCASGSRCRGHGVEAWIVSANLSRGLEGEQGNTNIDPMLDHQGVCCAECRRGYTHCQRICEPLGGYHPWPYHYRGCRVACRVIMPCNWWVARILDCSVLRSVTFGSCSKGVSRKKFPDFFNVRVAALELFNETKDSVAVTLPDLTHDAKRLAPFDVTEPPQAGVGAPGDNGLCVVWASDSGNTEGPCTQAGRQSNKVT